MNQWPFKLSVLVFLIAFLSGFYMHLSLMDNLIRAFVIYLVFSVMELAVLFVYNQSMVNFLKAQLEKKKKQQAEEVPAEARSSVESQT